MVNLAIDHRLASPIVIASPEPALASVPSLADTRLLPTFYSRLSQAMPGICERLRVRHDNPWSHDRCAQLEVCTVPKQNESGRSPDVLARECLGSSKCRPL